MQALGIPADFSPTRSWKTPAVRREQGSQHVKLRICCNEYSVYGSRQVSSAHQRQEKVDYSCSVVRPRSVVVSSSTLCISLRASAAICAAFCAPRQASQLESFV